MKTNYTDTELQAAIDEACNEVAQSAIGFLNTLDLDPQSKVWAEETPARLHLIEAALSALPEPMDEESMLLNLLAIIHRDGGHYQAEHGTRKAVEDACKEWQRLILLVEKAGLTEPKQSLSQLRPLAEAGDVPEGCVRYYTYKKDGEWTTKSKYRAMQDTHYIDTRLPEPEPLVTKPISPPTWTPAVGDVVTLKSGGPKMTVMQDMGPKFLCAYDFHGEVKTVSISTNCLQSA
jgi:uncharacterized protein YodC (DUF2158 family)